MKNGPIKIALAGFFSLALWGGCGKEKPAETAETRVAVVMNGGISRSGTTRGQIVPNAAGLPDEQLDVAIITVNYRTADPTLDQPDLPAWSGSTADITRGYFGEDSGAPGVIPFAQRPGKPIDSGKIEYTNDSGTTIQRVFYDETGEHYFVRVVYPYANAEFTQSVNGAGVIFSELDGSQDIMASNLGWGNMHSPVIKTNYKDDIPETVTGDSIIVMSHLFSLFRIKLVAENTDVIDQYGKILDVRLIDQPSSIRVDMMEIRLETESALDTPYHPKDFPGTGLDLTTSAVDAGYVMAMPAQKFTLEARSQNRLWLSADLDFSTLEDPLATSAPGRMYDITIRFMEAYEIELEAEPLEGEDEHKEWWMDSVFD